MSKEKKKQAPKKKWKTPKLEIISEQTFDKKTEIKVHAQYGTGGCSTGTHSTDIADNTALYVCM